MSTLHSSFTDRRDMGQILYSSLLILGLDAAALEHSLRTPVNPKMFVHMNKKLGEAILHFLFVCIDREKAAKVFRDCWPLLEKKQEAQFHRATFDWYKSLQQSYGQPVPAVVAKTFMAPGGPKFSSTVKTLIRIALHSSILRKAPDCTLLHFPSHSRSPQLNRRTLLLLQASKLAHHRNYITKQKNRMEILQSFRDRARELTSMYRRLCSENEIADEEFKTALNNNTALSQHQKETFLVAPSSVIKKEILDDIAEMNSTASKLWEKVEGFQKVEEASWKIISSLLDGTTFLSHINGSMYSPQVPEIVYKTHASTINKMGLHGLYRDDKLDLLSLMQYSNLTLRCLLDKVHSIHGQAKPESIEELNVQSGRVTSLSEMVNNLSSRMNTLLPSLLESVALYRSNVVSTCPASHTSDLEGKPHLCPPTPPLKLINTPVAIKGGTKYALMQLTPGTQNMKCLSQSGMNLTPNKLFSTIDIMRAAKKSPKANVVFSTAKHKDDSIQVMGGEHSSRLVSEAGLTMAMLTVDCRGRYQKKKEQSQEPVQTANNPTLEKQGYRSCIPKRRLIPKVLVNSSAQSTMTDIDISNMMEDFSNSLLDKLPNIKADNSDDSGVPELLGATLWDDVTQNGSSVDSGCVEMSSDSDTLLDVLGKMSIAPNRENVGLNEGNRSLRGTPRSKTKADLSLQSGRPTTPQQQQLSDVTIQNDQPVNLDNEFSQSLLAKLSFLAQSPLREETASVSSRTFREFDDYVSLECKAQNPVRRTCDEDASRSGEVEILRHDSKTKLNLLIEQVQQMKSMYPSETGLSKVRTKEVESKSNFMSYVENLKNVKDSNGKFSGRELENVLNVVGKDNTTLSTCNISLMEDFIPTKTDSNKYEKDAMNVDIHEDFHSNLRRMCKFLGDDDDDDDDTLTENNLEVKNAGEIIDAEETFASSTEIQNILGTAYQKSSYLPENSVFDTLIDSILTGESSSSILNDEAVKAEIRRESITSRRLSLTRDRTSFSSNKRLSGFFASCPGILDENDSCLLSSSLDDIFDV
ncbi:uncharacterized protein dgt6 [Procambarus clarkii]|uniref:uncharacterized protein dgt6 n=1 Tax=Procambarus clarkii TaxID=6728 RepID=UPI001E6707FB|nr:uncharacterized protein LOC123771065 [Procambarus clarkii]XP_045619317.1 uncharacterized protein LOC123771065 [Procambarus clarkii]